MARLLALLEKDFSGKTTVAECLRSKSIPSAEVKLALQDDSLEIDKSQIQISKSTILRSLMELKKAGENSGKSSLNHFSTIATTCHWIQFLCEFYSTSATEGEENRSPLEMYEEKPYSNAEVEDFIKKVLSSVSGVVAFLLDNPSHDDECQSDVDEDELGVFESDAKQQFDPRQVAVFTFSYVLRLNRYVYERPPLMSSIWKCLEKVASSLNPFPVKSWSSAFSELAMFLSEGVRELLLITSNAANIPLNTDSRLVSQCKVLKFVLSRITFLCKLPGIVDRLFQQRRLTGLISELSLLLGLCILRDGHEVETLQRLDFREQLLQVSRKANTLLSVLFSLSSGNDDHGLSDLFDRSLFSCEEEIASTEVRDDPLCARTLAVVSTGKLFMQMKILNDLALTDGTTLTDRLLERTLQFCEDNLFTNLPRTFGGPSDPTGETLGSVVDVFCFIGSSEVSLVAEVKSLSHRFHFLLISWLNRVASDDCHPISREVILVAICAYISRFEENTAFLELILGLLFDERTQDNLRHCLSEIVLRLSASDTHKDVLQRCIAMHAEKVLTKSAGASRKRKRGRVRCLVQSLSTVLCPVLSCARLAKVDSNKSINMLASTRIADDDLVVQIRSFDDTIAGSRLRSKRAQKEANVLIFLVQKYCANLEQGLSMDVISVVVGLLMFCFDGRTTPALAARALEVLVSLGDSLRTNISKVECDKIFEMMHNLLRSELWPLRTRCISAFILFATTVPKVDKGTVRDCLPKTLQKVFQYRLKKNPLYIKGDLVDLQISHCCALSDNIKSKATRRSVFPSRKTLHLSEGSFIIKMPTDGGREAIVVFPPGSSALNDIEFMLGNESDDRPTIHQLRRVVATKDGCKLSLYENS